MAPAYFLGREVFTDSSNYGQFLKEQGVGWVFLMPILLVCHIVELKGFIPDSLMLEVSPHKMFKLGSLSFPTFKQIETISWAGKSKVGSNSVCSVHIGCDDSNE